MQRLGIIVAIGLAVCAGLVAARHRILVFAISLAGPPPLIDAKDEGPSVRWHDDYFTVEALDERTWAIGEPRYAQQVYAYLILGGERGVLFDAGPGLRDIREVVASLTTLPVTFVPSHFHYDHIGNEISFDDVAVIDLPYLRARAKGGRLPLTFDEHVGAAEGFPLPTLEVDTWLPPGGRIELGGRSLEVLHTPGHTDDSITLHDLGSGDLFTGDFLYPGALIAFLSNSRLGDYLNGAERVLELATPGAQIFGAHRVSPPGAPRLVLDDLAALRARLREIRDGEGRGQRSLPRHLPGERADRAVGRTRLAPGLGAPLPGAVSAAQPDVVPSRVQGGRR